MTPMIRAPAAARLAMHGQPAGGRGASASACADLTNQLLSCFVDPRMCLEKTLTQQL